MEDQDDLNYDIPMLSCFIYNLIKTFKVWMTNVDNVFRVGET